MSSAEGSVGVECTGVVVGDYGHTVQKDPRVLRTSFSGLEGGL